MSLKAKLEAVVYAAEEPVALAQFAALFAAEALEWKAEREAAPGPQPAATGNEEPLLIEEFAYEEISSAATGDGIEAEKPARVQELAGERISRPVDVGAEQAEASAGDATGPEADLEIRRQARQRDREVRAVLKQLLDEIVASYADDDRGVEIREIAGGYRMATKPECHDAVRLFVKSLKPTLKLSLAALETLAVIAYKQPVTAPEVSEIRGVETSGVLGSLLARKLIATAGRKPVIGRPILYKTTKEFLLRFGLKDVSELPSMEEFEKMAAIELEEPESANADGQAGLAAEATWDQDPDSGEESERAAIEPPHEETDPGTAPRSAATPSGQELPVAELPVQTFTQPPAATAAQQPTETPAAMAAEDSAATEEHLEADASAQHPDPEHRSRPALESAAIETANEAD
jgi:segregation and condensation protein B